MAAVAHSPSFAKKVGVPQSVGKDFTAADKGKRFNGTEGSDVKETDYDDMSFSAAWRAARKDKGAGEVFTYKGKDYSTNTEEEGVGMRRQIPREGKDTSETGPSRGALGKSRAGKTKDETPFLSRGKDQAAGAALSRNPKLSAPKDEPLEESHPEDLLGVGKAVAGLGTAAVLARRGLPKILSKMGEIGANVERRAAAKAAEEAAENSSSRLSRLSKPLKEASKKSKEASDAYKGSGFRQHTDIKVGDTVKPSYNPNADRGYFKQWNIKAGDKMRTGGKVNPVKAYAKGGSVRGGGCESKGKTKGKFR